MNNSTAGLSDILLGSQQAELRRKPWQTQLQIGWDRARGNVPLYGNANQWVGMQCPSCSNTINVTTNVQVVQCNNCMTWVQRA